MRISLCACALALAASAVAGCGGDVTLEATVATLRPVRGAALVAGEAAAAVGRVGRGARVVAEAGSIARLDLDGGPRVLLGGATVTLDEASALTLTSGRLFFDARGDAIEVRTTRGTLRASDAGVSVSVEGDAVEVYAVRGEVGWATGEAAGVLGPGRAIALDGSAAQASEPTALWEDWTGGWAEAGPGDALHPVGVGMLEARVPREVGRARWPLVMRRLDVRVRVVRDLAITEVDQVFFNPASETLEGLYRVRVPEEAILSRFAVDREGRLVDGYVRERAQAERAYQAQVYVGSTLDPALLEWDGPGAYRARIYPIRPGETRRIVVRYAEWLGTPEAGRPRLYRYPMGGSERAPRVQELSLDVDLAEAEVERVRAGLGAVIEDGAVRLRLSDVVPRADFWLELHPGERDDALPAWRAPHEPPPRAPGTRAIEGEAEERDYWLLPLTLPARLASASDDAGLDVVVIADVSAGTDRGALELGRGVVESVAGLLRDEDRLAVVGADLTMRSIDGAPPALGALEPARVERLLDGLARVSPGGATDLGEVLGEAAGLLDPARRGVVVYVGDGLATVGERSATELRERLDRLPAPLRLYAVGVGPDADLEELGALVRGGGRALAVEERHEAADAALDLLAHARRPVAHRVELELGDGIENTFPRHAVDLVVGDVLPIIGRLGGDPPAEVRVRGTIAGEPFEETLALVTGEAPAATDLRLRWASARLDEQLLEGATREEIVELGVRHGLITPHTSFYVPSAAELRQMGIFATTLIDRPSLRRRARPSPIAQGALALAFAPFALAGCSAEEPGTFSSSSGAAGPASPPSASTPSASTPAASPPSADPAPPPDDLAMPAEEAEPAAGEPMLEAPAAPMPSPARRLRAASRSAEGSEASGSGGAALRRTLGAARGPAQACFARAVRQNPSLAGGLIVVRVVVGPDGRVLSATVATSSVGDPGLEACVLGVVRGTAYPATGETVTLNVPFSFAASGGARMLTFVQTAQILVELARAGAHVDSHTARPCSDAAELPLAERRELWRERLGQGQGWTVVRAFAIADCEVRSWRDRRALVSEILRTMGSVHAQATLAQQLGTDAERAYARSVVLGRVRTPEDVRVVRSIFGDEVGPGLVAQVLERAHTPGERARALRRLVSQYPRSFELRLRLIEALDAIGRHAEATRIATRMRADPLADPTVRTAIGERMIQRGDADEARRAFSEIVELAPLDELARRRLGDLYRAHGWFAPAYRQYETLRALRPDDPGVLLLLARAAAGAGRVDEALRLEQTVGETSGPSGDGGLARVAQLWSSVRYARLLDDAGADTERVEQLRHRRRRSSVLSAATQLRVTLTFAHPDAQLYLLAGMPGLRPSRPTDIAPEHGIEAFDLEEQEPGAYRVEVHRSADLSVPVEAELLVLWNEGQSNEQIRRVPLRFEPGAITRAWTITGRALVEAE